MKPYSTCVNISPNAICVFCVQVKYLLNFKTYKICVKKVHECLQGYLVPIDEYLNNIFVCGPFFCYSPMEKK